MPLNVVDTRKGNAKVKARYDENSSKAARIRIWEESKVRGFIKCYECSKICCVYANTDEGYWRNRTVLQQNLKIVAEQLCCCGLFFGDNYPLIKVASVGAIGPRRGPVMFF